MKIECDRFFDPPNSGTFCVQIKLVYEDPAEEGFVFPSLDDGEFRFMLRRIDASIVVVQPDGTTIILQKHGYSERTIEKAVDAVFQQLLFRGIRRKERRL